MKLRALIALMVGGVLSALFGITSTASAAPAAAPLAYPQSLCSTLSVSTTHPAYGESITVTGTAFEPNRSVKLVLKPIGSTGGSTLELKTVVSSATGTFTTTVRMPDASVNRGNYNIVAVTGYTTGSSCPADPRVEISLGALGETAGGGGGSTSGGGTAFTGVDIALLVALGVGLVAAGGVLAARGRRRVSA